MHKPSFPFLAGALASLLLAGAAPAALAQNAYEQGTARYRCTVLGDEKSCPQALGQPLVRIEDSLEPGPSAKHLIALGTDAGKAIAQARASGETPTRSVVRITRVDFTGQALYRQASGVTDLPAANIEKLYTSPR